MDSMQNKTHDSDHDHKFSIKPNSAQPNTTQILQSDPDLNRNSELHAVIEHTQLPKIPNKHDKQKQNPSVIDQNNAEFPKTHPKLHLTKNPSKKTKIRQINSIYSPLGQRSSSGLNLTPYVQIFRERKKIRKFREMCKRSARIGNENW